MLDGLVQSCDESWKWPENLLQSQLGRSVLSQIKSRLEKHQQNLFTRSDHVSVHTHEAFIGDHCELTPTHSGVRPYTNTISRLRIWSMEQYWYVKNAPRAASSAKRKGSSRSPCVSYLHVAGNPGIVNVNIDA